MAHKRTALEDHQARKQAKTVCSLCSSSECSCSVDFCQRTWRSLYSLCCKSSSSADFYQKRWSMVDEALKTQPDIHKIQEFLVIVGPPFVSVSSAADAFRKWVKRTMSCYKNDTKCLEVVEEIWKTFERHVLACEYMQFYRAAVEENRSSWLLNSLLKFHSVQGIGMQGMCDCGESIVNLALDRNNESAALTLYAHNVGWHWGMSEKQRVKIFQRGLSSKRERLTQYFVEHPIVISSQEEAFRVLCCVAVSCPLLADLVCCIFRFLFDLSHSNAILVSCGFKS